VSFSIVLIRNPPPYLSVYKLLDSELPGGWKAPLLQERGWGEVDLAMNDRLCTELGLEPKNGYSQFLHYFLVYKIQSSIFSLNIKFP
jgi:hypothetical protein